MAGGQWGYCHVIIVSVTSGAIVMSLLSLSPVGLLSCHYCLCHQWGYCHVIIVSVTSGAIVMSLLSLSPVGLLSCHYCLCHPWGFVMSLLSLSPVGLLSCHYCLCHPWGYCHVIIVSVTSGAIVMSLLSLSCKCPAFCLPVNVFAVYQHVILFQQYFLPYQRQQA